MGLSGAVPNTDRAIAATRGQVLTYQNQLVDALYSSTTGGITAAFSESGMVQIDLSATGSGYMCGEFVSPEFGG